MTKLNPIDVAIGNRVQKRRVEMNLSAVKLADTLGINLTTLVDLEAGRLRLHAHQLFVCAKTLGVEIGYFYQKLHSD